ncbi:UNVERIFIED_CONTAM: hypothetical protein Sradi_0221500 [Sesamum radiatum]|uniref:Uncharacterized protein n=1 Tax=Sesamum radiatum TaxID=300843 RepID=A0AAW2W2V6_SESRA
MSHARGGVLGLESRDVLGLVSSSWLLELFKPAWLSCGLGHPWPTVSIMDMGCPGPLGGKNTDFSDSDSGEVWLTGGGSKLGGLMPFTRLITILAPPPARSSSSSSSLATKAIRASSAYWDSSLSSVYEQSALHSPRGSTPSAAKVRRITVEGLDLGMREYKEWHWIVDLMVCVGFGVLLWVSARPGLLTSLCLTASLPLLRLLQDSSIYDHPPKKNMNDSKQGFWGVLARKAKSVIDDDGNMARPHETPGGTTLHTSNKSKTDQKGLDAIASSLNYIGGTIGNALEIRLQLESLLAEKARLAQENSVYARENRFLREIVEYHQLTMQDVVYLDEGTEEVTEVYPIKITTVHNTQSFGTIPTVSPTPTIPQGAVPQSVSLGSMPSPELEEVPQTVNTVNPYVQMPAEDVRRH